MLQDHYLNFSYYGSPSAIRPSLAGMPGSLILVKCIETGSYVEDNKLFEMSTTTSYRELLDIITKKYNNHPHLISYLDEQEEYVTIDSDLVLQKAVRLAT